VIISAQRCKSAARLFASAEFGLCTPGMGVNLWGATRRSSSKSSPLYVNPVNVFNTLTKVLTEGKGVSVRKGLKDWSEAQGEPQARATKGSGNPKRKAMSRRTETAYKAQSPGESAQHDETLDSGDRVNAAVV